MSVTKIVITGGPCAGKSTAMSTIQSELTKLGYKVYFIAESATEVILYVLSFSSKLVLSTLYL